MKKNFNAKWTVQEAAACGCPDKLSNAARPILPGQTRLEREGKENVRNFEPNNF